jgi:hypothetical protein
VDLLVRHMPWLNIRDRHRHFPDRADASTCRAGRLVAVINGHVGTRAALACPGNKPRPRLRVRVGSRHPHHEGNTP